MPNEAQIARRRSFAIISHPDAGKTTLTEKLLLYGGAVLAWIYKSWEFLPREMRRNAAGSSCHCMNHADGQCDQSATIRKRYGARIASLTLRLRPRENAAGHNKRIVT